MVTTHAHARVGRKLPLVVAGFLFMLLAASASHGHAYKRQATTIVDTLAQSAAVIVGTVTAIDERAGLAHPERGEALTRVTLSVDRVLLGSGAGKQVDLVFRGGVLADGSIARLSHVPLLATGDRYILFLRPEYYVSPLVNSRHALLRIVKFAERSVVVDEYGHGIVISSAHGLLHLRRIAASLTARYIEQEQARQSSAEGGQLEHYSEARLALDDVEHATDAEDVIEFIAETIRSTGKIAGTLPREPKPVDTTPVPTETSSNPGADPTRQ